jgi:uncharacterized protein (UPF0332 family)
MTAAEKQELITYRIQRAKETLQEVQLHIENELWITAINRIYYACFYAVSALLLKQDIATRTHAGTRQMFGLHFVKTQLIPTELGKFYSDIFEMRHVGDYDDFVDYTKEDVLEALLPAAALIETIESIVNTSNT